jgi:Smg protein|tara:strand:- start:66 stop:545 length:480 start_codon:yes stop_codon:yes gene_type:complete
MKETVFDVLMYLFDNYFEEDYEINSDQESLKFELVQAGFSDNQVKKAFDWLEGLALQKDLIQSGNLTEKSTLRMYSEREMEKLDVECRGFLLFLEQSDVLDAYDREVVIDRAMALEAEEIDLQQLKWVVLMVLLNQPGKEGAFTWMEDIVMDDTHSGLH